MNSYSAGGVYMAVVNFQNRPSSCYSLCLATSILVHIAGSLHQHDCIALSTLAGGVGSNAPFITSKHQDSVFAVEDVTLPGVFD